MIDQSRWEGSCHVEKNPRQAGRQAAEPLVAISLFVGAVLLTGVILAAPAVCRADPSFSYAPFTFTQFNPVTFDSFEWVRDQNLAEAPQPSRLQYAPGLDQRVRILANPYARAATVYYSNAYLKQGDSADAIELGWLGQAPYDIQNGSTAPRPIGFSHLASSGTNSLMAPGVLFRFRSGPAPTTVGVDSEDYGFTVSQINLNGASFGASSAHLLPPYERAIVLLNANNDIVDLVLPPRQTDEASTFAAWLNPPASPSLFATGVWARCNAFPDAANWDERLYFYETTPIFFELGACSGSWYVTIGTTQSQPVVVHATAGAHVLDEGVGDQRIGVKFNANASERAGIIYGFRSAAWRIYGASMGTLPIGNFRFYNNSNCGKLFGCGGGGCGVCVTTETCTTDVSGFDGYMTICNAETAVLRTNNWAAIDGAQGPALVIAHEAGHKWMGLPDEYQNEDGCPGVSVGLCGYSLMEVMFRNNQRGLCTDAYHRDHVDNFFNTPNNRIRGPNGRDCENNLRWVDAQSSWSRWSGHTPGNTVPAFGPQNLFYQPQGFTLLGPTYTAIGQGAFY